MRQKLSNILEIKKGKTITKSKAIDGDIPVIAAGTSIAYYHNEPNEKPPVITVSASGANAGYVWLHEYPIYASDCSVLKPKNNNKADIKYVYYMLKKLQEQIFDKQKGGGQPHVYPSDLENMEIPLPPLTIQQQIVEILDEADALRKKREKSLSMVSELSKPIFQKMFGSIHNPPSKFNRLPVGKLLLESPQNGIYKPQTEYGDGTAIIRIETYNSGDIITDKTEFRFVKLSSSEVDKYKVSNNDILVNRVNSPSHLGKVTLVRNLSNPTVFESNMMKIRLNPEKINPKFGFFNLTMPYVKRQILNLSRDAVNQSSINQSDVRSIEIIAPSQEEQKDFVDLVEEIIRQLDVQNKQKTILEDLYSSLLQKAFSGELKIN